MLTGCVVLALSCAAFGEEDRQSTDRPASAALHDTEDHKTFEGTLVPLFHALNGNGSTGSTDPLKPNPQPGSTTQPGSRTKPGEPGGSTQPGGLTQPGSANRSQAGLPGQDATTSGRAGVDSTQLSMGAVSASQPLALITSDSGSQRRSISSGESRQPTPPVGSSNRSSEPRSTPGSPSTGDKTLDGQLYVLVFDPADPQSRSAYLAAQAIVRSEATGSAGAIGKRGTRHSLGATGTTGVRETPGSRTDSRVIPGASGATGSNADLERDLHHEAARSSSELPSGMAERVKITGRVIERDGLQAIAVLKVERQHGDSTASVSPILGR